MWCGGCVSFIQQKYFYRVEREWIRRETLNKRFSWGVQSLYSQIRLHVTYFQTYVYVLYVHAHVSTYVLCINCTRTCAGWMYTKSGREALQKCFRRWDLENLYSRMSRHMSRHTSCISSTEVHLQSRWMNEAGFSYCKRACVGWDMESLYSRISTRVSRCVCIVSHLCKHFCRVDSYMR